MNYDILKRIEIVWMTRQRLKSNVTRQIKIKISSETALMCFFVLSLTVCGHSNKTYVHCSAK